MTNGNHPDSGLTSENPKLIKDRVSRLKRAAAIAATILVAICIVAVLLWRDRPLIDAIDWPEPAFASAADTVTVTWLGVSTLLFDDGETQILIDGFFSRPSLADILLKRPVDNDAATINYALNQFRMRHLAAIIPSHSHFDHAMDAGAIANRSSASILGTESTAQIARGAGVPEDQIVVVDSRTSFQFGEFKVTMLPTGHAPIGWRGSVPFDGVIEEPLSTPQAVSAWRMGGAFTVILEHPQGTALVQGSAAYTKYELRDIAADVVFLSVGQLDALGKDYAELYWQHTVTATGSHSVYPIHFDDFTKPFGEVVLWPKIVDNFATTSSWLDEFRRRWDSDATLYLPEFGRPIAIFTQTVEDRDPSQAPADL
ncbi:MAG: MBL fold metallo-hydrolase [Gammaproteobacteria bacterium]|nr:MBL fold metallo-hydrolase [Gammaproteobacteria bacterium]MDH5240440.1 MBL fold metallo-hydrolase [Gammaproteobacteria bacterium]MDH5260452.1 MBL fold metallo-hydrolase [Gammaproteobacteria bacterium]MDH5584434.1 MBL fold metallo-hydrolase [Gammaproteobacteria bacterium]